MGSTFTQLGYNFLEGNFVIDFTFHTPALVRLVSYSGSYTLVITQSCRVEATKMNFDLRCKQ